jgi:hypothetical protein
MTRSNNESPQRVGVFLADSDIDDILKLSELPNHDRWDPESRRLAQLTPSALGRVRSIKLASRCAARACRSQ